MTWLAIRLFLGSALKKLGSLNLWQLLCIALALFGAVQTLRLSIEKRHAHKVEAQLGKEIAAHKRDIDSYRQAQADAAAANKAQVAAIRQKQQEITDATVSRLNSRLELIRGELRKPAAQGSANSPGASDSGSAPCRAFDPAWLCVAPEERLRAAENEERHDELIDWTIQQSKVKP
jgi:hypothetical protein